jgi:hypothetical protein
MFVGHYGPSLVVKAAKASIPLWVLFLAVQLVDVFWSIFVLAGIEKARITWFCWSLRNGDLRPGDAGSPVLRLLWRPSGLSKSSSRNGSRFLFCLRRDSTRVG